MARQSPETGLHGVFVRFYKKLTKLNNANVVQSVEYISTGIPLFWCMPKTMR